MRMLDSPVGTITRCRVSGVLAIPVHNARMMRYLNFVYRMLRRDARAGELYLLVAALIVAVAALTAVGFFTDRVRRALEREANQLLGADMLLTADHPWNPTCASQAKARGLRVVETDFPEHGFDRRGDGLRAQLADIKGR